MELNDLDISVYTPNTSFKNIKITYHKVNNQDCFMVCVDDKFYLRNFGDGVLKFIPSKEMATFFTSSPNKPNLVHRATECLGLILSGQFPIEVNLDKAK